MYKRVLTIVVAFLLFFACFIETYASDVSSNFTITDAHFCSDLSCETEYDENNGIISNEVFLAKINWSYESTEGIKNGDYVSFPFANETITETTTIWNGSISKIDMYDSNNNKIGQWEITGSNSANHKVKLYFSDYAIGKTSLSGTLITSKNIHSTYSYKDIVVPIKVGNLDKKILLLKNPFTPDNRGFYIGLNSSNNSIIRFGVVTPTSTMKQIYQYDNYSELTDDSIYKNIICEIPIPSNANSVEGISINSRLLYPTDKENHLPSSSLMLSNAGNAISSFTKVEQTNNETYSEFKDRISKYHYGVYNDNEGTKTIIFNMGSQPSDDFTYHSIIGSNPGDYVYRVNPFSCDSDIRDIVNKGAGPNNIIGGRVAQWIIYYSLKFDPVSINTPINTSAICNYQTVLGENKTIQMNGSGTMTPAISLTGVRGQSKLLLLDKDSKAPLKNVSITLQKKDGDNWIDISTIDTDASGFVTFNSLDDGEYRYVQNNYLSHYKENSYKLYSDSNTNNEITSFELNSDGNISYATNERESYTITYKRGSHGNFEDKSYNVLYGDATPIFTNTVDDNGWNFVRWNPSVSLTVTGNATYTAQWEKEVNLVKHYYLENTTTKIKSDESSIVKVGDSYNVSRLSVDDKYVYVSTVGTENGIVPDGDVIINYYFKLKPSILSVYYLEDGTDNELADPLIRNLKYDDIYNTESSSNVPKNYNLVRIDGEASGTVSSDNIIVKYYYKKKNSLINSTINKSGTEEITSKNSLVSYRIKYDATINDYIGNGVITITDKLPYSIDLDNSNLDGGTYNSQNNTITWNISWNNIDTYSNNSSKSITKNISLKYVDIDSTKRVLTNEVIGKIDLDNNSDSVLDSFDSNIKIKGKVIIRYVDDDNNNIDEAIIYEKLVGEIVESEQKEFDGYYFIEGPDTQLHEIKDDTYEVIYKYKKYVYNIETIVNGEGGKVRGNEAVKYGDNSTPKYIVIEADDNYCINSIKVNNQDIKVTACKMQILDNFKDVKENKKVEVTFRKVYLLNPNTSSKIFILLFIIGSLLFGTIIKIKKYN